MNVRGLIDESSRLLFKEGKYDEAIEILHQAWDGITDKSTQITEQIRIKSWLGHCYYKQAMKVKDTDEADKSFSDAITYGHESLELTQELEIEQLRSQIQIPLQFWLGYCYLEWIKRTKSTSKTVQASEKFSAAYEQLSQLSDEEEIKEWKKNILQGLRDIDYLNKDWYSYFEKKKQEIQELLFKNKTSQPQDAVATVLAVLHIPQIELGFTPMAHYTSPHVCHILFGIDGNEIDSKMRLGSSTYMNDPSEGRALLDLLNQQDLELENKADGASHNAFFTCFSSRVNDLNQFRLYGKEGDVEASGCCLVFNKNGDWLEEADVSASFHNPSPKKLDRIQTTSRKPILRMIKSCRFIKSLISRTKMNILRKKNAGYGFLRQIRHSIFIKI